MNLLHTKSLERVALLPPTALHVEFGLSPAEHSVNCFSAWWLSRLWFISPVALTAEDWLSSGADATYCVTCQQQLSLDWNICMLSYPFPLPYCHFFFQWIILQSRMTLQKRKKNQIHISKGIFPQCWGRTWGKKLLWRGDCLRVEHILSSQGENSYLFVGLFHLNGYIFYSLPFFFGNFSFAPMPCVRGPVAVAFSPHRSACYFQVITPDPVFYLDNTLWKKLESVVPSAAEQLT